MRTILALTSLLAAAHAQVAAGDIAVTGFSTTSFGLVTPPNVTGFSTLGFQGTGVATSQAILWDPAQPNDFLIGGFGFVGRAQITGPGAVGYQLITNNVGIVSQMSWDGAGQVVFVDSGTDQVRRLDPATGVVVDLSVGAQPWGSDAGSGAWDPRTGDCVVGGNGSIHRLAHGAAVATPIVSGLGGHVSAIAFDPVTGDVLATVLTVNRFVRIDGSGAVSNVAPPGSIPGPNALDVDENGNYVTGGGTGQVYRVPHAGGAPTFLASNTSPANAVNGLAVAHGGGMALPYGSRCSGANGPVALAATGPFRLGSAITTTSTNHAPGALGALVLGLGNTSHAGLPLPYLLDPLLGTAGCSLHCSIDATLVGSTSTGSPATLTFGVTLPPAFAGLLLYVQHACFEPVAGGLSWSNGLVLQAR